MKKEEILEKNRRHNENAEEDEREEYISGKAGVSAKIAFTLVVILIAMYKRYKNIPSGDILGIFMTYCATESLYKYYYLRNKKMLLAGIFFSIFAICLLLIYVYVI